MFVFIGSQNENKIVQNSIVICLTYGMKHEGRPCYRKTGAWFGYRKQEHMIRDCPDNKKFIIRMPKKENREDKHKFFKDGLFAMTHSNT